MVWSLCIKNWTAGNAAEQSDGRTGRLTQPHDDDGHLSNTAYVRWLVLEDVPEEAWPIWLAGLDNEERARAGRLLREADRRQFIAAHTLLRVLLFWAAGTAPRDWRFIVGFHGKPALHPDHARSALTFNISHTSGAVACGIAPGCPIGVDIEDGERTGRHLDIAEAYFAPSEISCLRAAPARERPALFLLFWTLKEAYIKASGQGLSLPLDRFAVSLAPIAISFPEPGAGRPANWQFETVACTSRHRLSVALHTEKAIPLQCSRMSYNEIERLLRVSNAAQALTGEMTTTETGW